jgi:hypothetical protein
MRLGIGGESGDANAVPAMIDGHWGISPMTGCPRDRVGADRQGEPNER